jgi:eukaryotic-like serine/threonine-protein kinase
VRAAGEVEHRNLVPIIETGELQGWRYVVMPYGGRSLAERLAAEGPLPVDDAIGTVAQVAAGLNALHSAGLIHRDVKPQNILVDDRGVAALGDFGLSKGRDYTVLTRAGDVVGTVDYLAPELVRGGNALAASDIYALGCVAYESLTGAPPFGHLSVLRVGLAHLNEQPADPCEVRPELPAAVGRVILDALAKEPTARPVSAVAFARMLDVARRATSRDEPRPG